MNPVTSQKRFYADRVEHVPQSFIREILKVTNNPEIVSFAGGLPNPQLFPVDQLKEAAMRVFEKSAHQSLQYAATEGLLSLREYISDRYKKRFNLHISPQQILITNGSQQALDLIGKLFLNPGDKVLVERPSYLGALQCFSMFQTDFIEVTLEDDGVNIAELEHAVETKPVKLFFGIPNFQNPTGISYSSERRKEVADLLRKSGTVFIEDDPYGEISFGEGILNPIYSHIPEQTILLGSFSKIIAPGLRLGWMVANPEIIKKASILKQASDLHSGNLTQYILNEFLQGVDLDCHVQLIRDKYRQQCSVMMEAIHRYFPFAVQYTRPSGGMFCWITLPEWITARDLLERALKENIIFVPGDPFYASGANWQTLRLNFSNVEEDAMKPALQKLGSLLI